MVYSLQSELRDQGHACYSLHRGERELAASDDSSTVIDQLLWQISSDTVDLARGYLLIHAGAVVAPTGDGVMILGESGSGKTTLVAALVQEGFGYLSDEAAAIELATGLVHPWPRPLGFKAGSRALARFEPLFATRTARSDLASGGESADELHVRIDDIRQGAVAEPCPVRHVIDHVYEPDAGTRLEPLARSAALVRMGSAAPRLRREGDRGLDVLAAVVRDTAAHTLVSGDLEQSVRAVRELVRV